MRKESKERKSEMGLYSDKLQELAPVLKRYYIRDEKSVLHQYVSIEGCPEDYYASPYLEQIKDFCGCSDDMMGKRVFLITEEENIGIKAAFGIMNYPLYANWDEICEQMEEAGYETNHLVIKKADGSPVQMRLVTMKDYSVLLTGAMSEKEVFYFTGLDENDDSDFLFENKLKCIMSCPALLQFVQLKREQVDTPWARELMMNRECEVIYLPKVESSYYTQILNDLLLGERYSLDKCLKPERMIRNMMKKCAGRFGEEDIAWSLDQAEKHARLRGEYHVLGAVDFPFDSYEELSPLSRLEQMTGLNNMKNLAFECAALVKEQMRNSLLTDVCKHVIFKGRPGTGKTMCGRILAQIMAEQGQSNGVFIQASRKDIIGEHVGQTAPKVAGLFAKARNGILFVDEAGFLMHEARASYNQEAIKEFVRYMELYQDVTVIFALYPHEVEEWLKMDAGLSSRISRIVEFEDYTEDELLEIAEGMCKGKGYKLEEAAKGIIRTYISRRSKLLGDEFGNAREARKLVESAIIARSIRCYECDTEDKELVLLAGDFEYGVKRLRQEKGKKTAQIGFAIV